MSELALRTLGTKRQHVPAPVRPRGPAFDDRPSLVSVTATLGAQHHSDVGALTADRRARHGNRLRLVCPREKSRPAIGDDLQMHGRIAGSPVETDGSGHVRVRHALSVLVANRWVEVEQTVGEMRISLGERARKLTERTPG
jgi:hypothetical protein